MSDDKLQTTEEQNNDTQTIEVAEEQPTIDVASKKEEKKEVKAEAVVGEKSQRKSRGKKEKSQVLNGKAFIKATYNNTIVSLTDGDGGVIAWSSAGRCGFKGPKKATPYAATIIVKDVAEKAKLRGLKEVEVFVKGVGQGRESAIRSLHANGIEVVSIKDVTPIPHNGCRQKKPRRV